MSRCTAIFWFVFVQWFSSELRPGLHRALPYLRRELALGAILPLRSALAHRNAGDRRHHRQRPPRDGPTKTASGKPSLANYAVFTPVVGRA